MEASIVIPKLEELLHSDRAYYIDYDTRIDRHQQRVMEISVYIAEMMGLSKERIDDLKIAARFHDYGKRFWHPAMLHKKKEVLDPYEAYLIKTHAAASVILIDSKLDHVRLGRINKEVVSLLNESYQNIFDIIKYHHENYDGSGNPYGLNKDQVPLEAQIMRVADSYDAMRSPRLYRSIKNQMMAHQRAVSELVIGMGTEFNPHIVRLFLEIPAGKLQRLYEHVSEITEEKQREKYGRVMIPN